MPWNEVEARTGRRWERADGTAVLSVRETATGDWAVTLDVLEQAPDGPAYERRTHASESSALDRASSLRDARESAE